MNLLESSNNIKLSFEQHLSYFTFPNRRGGTYTIRTLQDNKIFCLLTIRREEIKEI